MPLPVAIEASRRRWWGGVQHLSRQRNLPERWADVPDALRRPCYTMLAGAGETALPMVARKILQVPAWTWQAMRPEVVAALAGALSWMLPHPDCGPDQPFLHFDHDGRRYYMPAPNGENLVCLEYPLADEYLAAYLGGDASALPRLVATLCRMREADPEMRRRRGDQRRPLHSRSEAEALAEGLHDLHPAHSMHVLYWFAGLKQYVAATYKTWLFESQEDEEGDDDNDDAPQQEASASGPDFGWWGIFQDVAEAGAFGHHVDQVLQAPFHDVCVWLVRQRVKADAMRQSMPGAPAITTESDD